MKTVRNTFREVNAVKALADTRERYENMGVFATCPVSYKGWVEENVYCVPRDMWGMDEWKHHAEEFAFHMDFTTQLYIYDELKLQGAPTEAAWHGFKCKAKENARMEIYLQKQSKWIPRKRPTWASSRRLDFVKSFYTQESLIDFSKTGVMPVMKSDFVPFMSFEQYKEMEQREAMGIDTDGDYPILYLDVNPFAGGIAVDEDNLPF